MYYRYFVDGIASMLFASIGASGKGEWLGAIGGFFFGYFFMGLLRIWRRHLIIRNLECLKHDVEVLEELRKILPDNR